MRCSFGGILEESKISQESKFRISSLAHFQVFSSSPLLAGRQKNIMASTSCKKSSIFAAGEVTLLRHITILSSARVTMISTKVIKSSSSAPLPDHHIRAARLESDLSSNSALECPGDDGTYEPRCIVMLGSVVHCTTVMLLVGLIGLNSILHCIL